MPPVVCVEWGVEYKACYKEDERIGVTGGLRTHAVLRIYCINHSITLTQAKRDKKDEQGT